MLFVLHTMTNIKVGDFYPVQSDTSIGAMLSKIKYIRNETTQSFDGLLSQERFNQYWDAVGQVKTLLHITIRIWMLWRERHISFQNCIIINFFYCFAKANCHFAAALTMLLKVPNIFQSRSLNVT